MIIRSRWRCAGGLAAHLLRTDTNERVRVRDDLGRDVPCDVHHAVALFSAIARTNVRTKRDLVHVKIAPDAALSDEDLVRLVARIETEHRIPSTMPRLVVEHAKGARARHFHLTYPVVDPATGRAVRSEGNYTRDELISRMAEIELGERIVPGPRQNAVVEELRRRGRGSEADTLALSTPTRRGDRLSDDTRQQAATLAVDAKHLMIDAYAIWQAAGGDPGLFATRCAERGYAVAKGNRAFLFVHEASGAHVPLARALRQKAKEAGVPLMLRERDFQNAFPMAASFADTRDAGLEAAAAKAKAAADGELGRMQEEARRDGQLQLAERLRLVRERAKRERKLRVKMTLVAKRLEIKAEYARRDRIRRARVNRAFQVARIVDRREWRRLAVNIAGAGVLLAGGGLGVALVAAGIAVAVLPTRERARTFRHHAQLQREADRDAAARASQKAYDAEVAKQTRAAKLDFAALEKRHRIVAGAWCHLILDETDGRLTVEQTVLKAALARVLGKQAEVLEGAVLLGAGRGVLTVLRWYDPLRFRHRQAVAAALRQAGETEASVILAPRGAVTPSRDGRSR